MGVLLMFTIGCKKDDKKSDTIPPAVTTVTDIDGNVYHTVTIGTQVWMVENLKTTKYRDGTAIPNVTVNSGWTDYTTGYYCDYDNTPSNSIIYGRLYNWDAVYDSHNIAPIGWHVPSDAEWTTLINYLGGDTVAGGKMKESGLTHWINPNVGANNSSSFTALPGGFRENCGTFNSIGINGSWWSTTEHWGGAWYRSLNNTDISVVSDYMDKANGYSIRCIKD